MDDHAGIEVGFMNQRSRLHSIVSPLSLGSTRLIDGDSVTTLTHCDPRIGIYRSNLAVARALALAASSCRFFGDAVDSSEVRSVAEILATSSTAAENAFSLTLEGVLKPVIFLTNCSAAARTSASVTGGSKL
jgi:hypothetical protein